MPMPSRLSSRPNARSRVLAAAQVGGILANSTYPADFIRDNLAIQTNVIHEAWRAGVKRLLFLGSSCIYPRDCPQPIREDYLLTGPLEPTNRPYAIAKIAGIEMCWAYNRQYGTQYLCAMPTNLYGPGDNYDLHTGHVLPALIRRFHEAEAARRHDASRYGAPGTPRREFLLQRRHGRRVRAPAGASRRPSSRPVFNDREPPLVNVGCGVDVTIRELARARAPDRRCRRRGRVGRLEAGRHAAQAARHRQGCRRSAGARPSDSRTASRRCTRTTSVERQPVPRRDDTRREDRAPRGGQMSPVTSVKRGAALVRRASAAGSRTKIVFAVPVRAGCSVRSMGSYAQAANPKRRMASTRSSSHHP